MSIQKSKSPCIREFRKWKIHITMIDNLFIKCQPTLCQHTPRLSTTSSPNATNAASHSKVKQDFSPIKRRSTSSQFIKPSSPQRANNQLKKSGLRILTLSSLRLWLTTLVTCQEVVAEAAWDSKIFTLQMFNNWCGKEKDSKISVQRTKGERMQISITDKTSSKKGIILRLESTRSLNEGNSHLPPKDPTSISMRFLSNLSSKSPSWSLSHVISAGRDSTTSTK